MFSSIKHIGMHSTLFCQRQLLLVLPHHHHFAATQRKHLRCQLAHLAIAQYHNTVGRSDMHLLEDLKVGGQGFDKDGFLVTNRVRDKVQIFQGQGEIFGKGSVAVNDTERGAIWTMCGHILLAVVAIGTVAGGGNLNNDTLPDKVSILFLGNITIDFFHYAHKLVTRNALKIQIATGDFQVGVADTCKQDVDKSFAINWNWHGIISLKYQASFPAYQCSHNPSPDLLFPTGSPSIY